jgi:hypothetical protein
MPLQLKPGPSWPIFPIELRPSILVFASALPIFSLGIGLFILIAMLKKIEGKS